MSRPSPWCRLNNKLTAWAYVALRVVHSLIHLSYNHVLHRLAAFTLSNAALVSLWVIGAEHVVT